MSKSSVAKPNRAAALSARAEAENPNMALTAEGFLTVTEAVQFSRIGRSELYELMKAGHLTFAHHGRRRVIPKRALRELMASRIVPATA